MSLIVQVLEIVAPVFLLAALGFVWVRLGFDYSISFVTRLAMTVSVPCLIFVALMKTEISEDNLTKIALSAVLSYALITGLFFIFLRMIKKSLTLYWAPMIFGNTGNLGLPLALFAFGAEGLGYAVVIFAIMGIYSFTLGIWMVSGKGGFRAMLREPIVWGSLLGGVFLVMGWTTPDWITNTLELTGQMAIPLMLITLGVALSRLRPHAISRSVLISLVKVVLCTATATAVGLYLALPPVALAVLVLQIATPVAVTSYLLAQKYGENPEEIAGLVVISTLLSVIYLPVLLGFLI